MSISNKYIESLKNTPLFKETDIDKNLKKFLNKEDIVKFKKGEVICSPDKFNKSLGIVLKGEAQIRSGKPSENKVILSNVKTNDVFGVSTIFNRSNEIPITVSTLSSSTVLFINENNLKEMFLNDEKVLENYLHLVTENIHFLNKKIDGFTAKSAEERLAVYLVDHMTSDESGGYVVESRYSMTKLATVIDLGRASLYRALDTLEDNYIILRNKKTIKILDVDKLKKLINR